MRRGGLLFWQEVLVSIGQLLAGWFVGMFSVRSTFWLCVLLLAFGRLAVQAGAAGALAPPAPTHLVTLGWNASPDRNAVGYFLLYGTTSGVYTNQLDVGNMNSATVTGLQANVMYYFSVVAHDATGQQSPPSNEIAYTVPADSPARTPPTLGLQLAGAGHSGATLRLSFQANAATIYQLQATRDFIRWQTLCTTNCASDRLVGFYITDLANYPRRFYRLAYTAPVGPALGIGLGRTGAGAVLRLSFQGGAGRAYDIQASQDFQHWAALWTTNCASDGLVVFDDTDTGVFPRRFYRLAQR